ncbi:MAG TPA: sodium/proline symporter [Oscillospiraceae bacterium]|nr:sodium/proline symporter [Oscillospiraceae bacterium]
MTQGQIFMTISIVLYIMLVIVIGLWYAKKNKTTDDFYIGGRTLGPYVTAMSAEATDMSAWLLMGLPGTAYFFGTAEAFWTAVGLAVGTYLAWLLEAKRLRRYSQAVGAITIPDFFANRFHDKSKLLLLISSITIIVFFVPYTSSGFNASGKLFASLFGVDYRAAMLISAVVIVVYTALGGFLAESTTDLIQGIIMSFSLGFVFIYGVIHAGGFGNVIENASKLPGYLSVSASYVWETGGSQPYTVLAAICLLAWGLGYFGMPHFVLRFMAIRDENKIKVARRVASIWVVISMSVAILIGVTGFSLSQDGMIASLNTYSDAETVIVSISNYLSQHGVIAALLAGLVIAGILASTMSTSDSQLLVASSAVAQNVLQGVFGVKLTEKQAMLAARLTVIAIAVIAAAEAWEPGSVFSIVSFAWAGFGAAFGPVMLCGLFWKRTNCAGALAGMISGGAMVFIWKYLVRPLGGGWNVYELLPAFIFGLMITVIVSLLTERPSAEMEHEFDYAAGKVNLI